MNEYDNRLYNLRSMGFKSYWHYINSPLWKTIRSRVLLKLKHKCKLCGKNASEVHHLSYSVFVLNGNDDSQLIPLCHHNIEFDGVTKRSFNEALLHFRYMCLADNKPNNPSRSDLYGSVESCYMDRHKLDIFCIANNMSYTISKDHIHWIINKNNTRFNWYPSKGKLTRGHLQKNPVMGITDIDSLVNRLESEVGSKKWLDVTKQQKTS